VKIKDLLKLAIIFDLYFTKVNMLSQNISCAQTNIQNAQKENVTKPKNDRQNIRRTLFSQCTVQTESPINQKY
jgi:hypothetical protein